MKMKTRLLSKLQQESHISTYTYILCISFFICGCIVGTFVSGLIQEGDELYKYLSSYLSFVDAGGYDTDFFSVFVGNMKYPVFAVLLGLSIFGVLGIPLLSGVRGFFLAFSISAMVRTFGGDGVMLSLAVFGISTLFTLPCFFMLAAQGTEASALLLGLAFKKGHQVSGSIYGRTFWIRCVVCVLAILLGSLLDKYLSAALLRLAAKSI